MMNAIATIDEISEHKVEPAKREILHPSHNTQNSSAQLNDMRRILDAAVTILAQGEDLLRALSPETYTRRVPLAFNASVGGHYRHCLDHFTNLLRGLDADQVDYDHRDRDSRIESQPEFALALTQQIRAQLRELPLAALDAPVRARCEVSYSHGDSPVTGSTFGREMVYAIAHAIHHYALISVMARLMNAKLPEHFGVAPSTVAHQNAILRKAR
ncbi:MAG: DinB family protein [Verrucomicrobia subdivision 3 bacterium]|nr:DinB family protein [Limisphaerales bacterium]